MKRSTRLAVLTNNPEGAFQRNVLTGVLDVTGRAGTACEVIVVLNQQPPAQDLTAFDGLIVIANVLPDDFLRDLHRRGVVMSLASHRLDDLPIPAVSPSNAQGMAVLVEHLVVACRCRNIAFIQGNMDQIDGWQRAEAFHQEMMRYDLQTPPELIIKGEFEPSRAAAALADLVARQVDFDAVACSDYLMAAAAVETLRKAGLHVPGQIAVAGFGDGPESEAAGITTVAADVTELGRRAARQLLGQLKGMAMQGLTLLSADLMVRQTTV